MTKKIGCGNMTIKISKNINEGKTVNPNHKEKYKGLGTKCEQITNKEE